MSFKEVKELRTNGKIQEALDMATRELEADPTNIWNKRSISWVYYEYVKRNASIDGFNDFKSFIEKILNLELSHEDAIMLHENVAIQLGKVVYAIYKEREVDYTKVDQLFELSKKLWIGKPSNANSFIIKAFLKGNKTWPKIIDFIDFFGFASFQESDFKAEEFNGRAISSTVEKFFNAYSKKLIDSFKELNCDRNELQNRIGLFLPILDAQISNNPEYQFLPYFKAKLLIHMGEKDQVLTAFLPFAKRKKNDFWVWEVIAETFPKNDEYNFACHCKALSLSSPEEYLVGLRKDFAEMLIFRGLYAEAKCEITKLIDARTKNGWKVPNDVLAITNLSWYPEIQGNKSNQNFYVQYTGKAEAILFQETPEEIVVVEFVNSDKQVLNFVKDESKHGFFSYKGQINKPEIGDVLKVRFHGEGKDGRYQILSLLKDNSLHTKALISFKGKVKRLIDKEFAFVDNYFIEPRLVAKHQLSNNMKVNGKAILSFNKLKSTWGWKVIEIT
jgi:hypothetical protein